MGDAGITRAVAIIPARMASSRFPGKPLADLLGAPMIEHVYRRTCMSKLLDEVYIATCDEEIAAASSTFGAPVIMTSDRHERASERVAEAAERIDAEPDVVVMVQGDEPMTTPAMVDSAVTPLLDDSTLECVNLVSRIWSADEHSDPNAIKVVMDTKWNALYFSREPIPTSHVLGAEAMQAFRQVCVIPFRSRVLRTYAALEPTPLEQAESVDMLRLLEHGFRIRLVETDVKSHPVDTPEDLAIVTKLMRSDDLLLTYLDH